MFSDQLSRLHMILKPFMLRRIKKDVENELSDKVEVEMIKPFRRSGMLSISSAAFCNTSHSPLGVCPPPRCHTKPRNRPVSDAGVGRLLLTDVALGGLDVSHVLSKHCGSFRTQSDGRQSSRLPHICLFLFRQHVSLRTHI